MLPHIVKGFFPCYYIIPSHHNIGESAAAIDDVFFLENVRGVCTC